MSPAEFKLKWHRYTGKESSAYQSHFNDLCDLLQQPTPVLADPSGSEFFCFQKRVTKDVELFALHEEAETEERGFAAVWKKGFFAWEYKRKDKHKDLGAASQQLLLYREDLESPPLLVVCDISRHEVHTNFKIGRAHV